MGLNIDEKWREGEKGLLGSKINIIFDETKMLKLNIIFC